MRNNYNPQFPVYIVSKGRYESRLTAKALDKCGVNFYIIVEEKEYELYSSVIPRSRVLILPERYLNEYDTFDTLGRTKSTGPGAARNFAWDHSLSIEASWHWVMDDNISMFCRLYNNIKTPVACGNIFRAMEDFCLRYENVRMAGPNYFMFASRKSVMPPYVLNTRIYSCNLIRNDSPFRWRGRYNEDTDLSLRMLKAGYATIQFNAFLQYKMPTQSIKGGNTSEFYHKEGTVEKGKKYATDGTLAKSEMQVAMHPDVSELVWKFGRWHHHVNYAPFKNNPLNKKAGLVIPKGIDNYGMILKITEDETLIAPKEEELPTEISNDDLTESDPLPIVNSDFVPEAIVMNPEDVKKLNFEIQTESGGEFKPIQEGAIFICKNCGYSTNDSTSWCVHADVCEEKKYPIINPETKTAILQEIKKIYLGLYCVSFSYELQEEESWGDRPKRFTGTEEECNNYIETKKPK